MLHAFLKKGSFQDSVSLMLISRDLSKGDDVNRVSIMMGTPANKDVFRETGMWHDLLNEAAPNDICIVIDSDRQDDSIIGIVREHLEQAFVALTQGRKQQHFPVVHSFRRAQAALPKANLALISIAGAYAHDPAEQALKAGMHVMLFSDNVDVSTERRLKEMGRERNLLVMGPDCGTAIVNGAPLAFANRMKQGPIGIVGASGTGIQELCSQIALQGSGITHALGLGGRDLSEKIGGISALMALDMLSKDPASKVIAFVSKPPAPSVKEKVTQAMLNLGKPVVALFLGEVPAVRQKDNVFFAYTLDEAAQLAADLAHTESLRETLPNVHGKKIAGLYSGGTLAAETSMLMGQALGLPEDHEHAEGFMLRADGNTIVDLGDDMYTRGRPHPMIDPSVRNEKIIALARQSDVGVLMLDVVIGFGSHQNPAGEVADAVKTLMQKRGENPLIVLATVTGTADDPQDRDAQVAELRDAGIIVAGSTREAVMLATRLVSAGPASNTGTPAILKDEPQAINIGLRGFAEDLQTGQVSVVHYQWAPSCGGDERMRSILEQLQ